MATVPGAQPPTIFKNPGIAIVLSFFFPGLGQLYNGEIKKGILFIVCYAISIVLMFVIIGFFTAFIVWIWAMVDANSSAKRINLSLAAGNQGASSASI